MIAMGYDVGSVDDIPLSALARKIPGSPTYHTVRRWAVDGALSRSGQRVRLETVKLPGGLGSSPVRYRDFLRKLES